MKRVYFALLICFCHLFVKAQKLNIAVDTINMMVNVGFYTNVDPKDKKVIDSHPIRIIKPGTEIFDPAAIELTHYKSDFDEVF